MDERRQGNLARNKQFLDALFGWDAEFEKKSPEKKTKEQDFTIPYFKFVFGDNASVSATTEHESNTELEKLASYKNLVKLVYFIFFL